MNTIKTLFLIMIASFTIMSCGNKTVADPPELSDQWFTVYDKESTGLSQGWSVDFPEKVSKNSLWDDWLMRDVRYRWHMQTFDMAQPDSNSKYLINIKSAAGPAIIWLNGHYVDNISAGSDHVSDLTPYCLANNENMLVIRSEKTGDGYGIQSAGIIKAPADTALAKAFPSYNTMPRYNIPDTEANDMIIYEIFLRNYSSDGDFNGLQNRVWRLKQLGINTVWLMPIHPIGKEKKKGPLGSPYSVQNLFSTNPDYGTFSAFDSLKTALHRNDIDIMLDAVCHHTSWDNIWVKQQPEYYKKNDNGNIICPEGTDWSDVAQLNYDNAGLRKKMISYFDFWMDMGVDAFRCDAAEMIPLDFWRDLRDHLNSKDKNPFLLAESTRPEAVLFGFDAVYGWDTYRAFSKISNGKMDPRDLGSVLVSEVTRYPEGSKILHFAENHDTPRAAKILGTKGHHLALVTIFTAPGIPMIYNGQELNDTTRMDLTDKTNVSWYRVHWNTFNLIRDLSELRKSSTVLTRGNIKALKNLKSGMAAFSRRYRNETWLILMNYGEKPVTYECRAGKTLFSSKNSGLVQRNLVRLQPGGYCIVK